VHIEDFTTKHYRELICFAKQNYLFVSYGNIPNEGRFVLWRHDCDFSLNRAYRLACIEEEEGVRSTYFINPHSEFYNPFEKGQAKLIEKILGLGHDIGLHFDAGFYETTSADQLNEQIGYEASLLRYFFGVKSFAFSFHNPTDFLLKCENDCYGGLLNCYSAYFKNHVAYCSDSSGYWRHRRLVEVLMEATDERLQILTHPVWWQEEAMYPRDRVRRAIEGRSLAVMRFYKGELEATGRVNPSANDDKSLLSG